MVRAQSGRVPELVVAVSGALAGSTVPQWSREFDRVARTGADRLVVDLSACPRIDTAAIVILLRLHRQMKRSGGRLVLRHPAPAVVRLFMVARVDQVLTVEDSPAVQQPSAET
ncbi:STAS domain-containing protein [Actinoplanes sp. NPDC051859]|uniref:STAS domain-containing protein n=1 Tax=Actinoplanes sp. NPDC051859 TaxID=3363909 RepID=UPI0037B78F86